MLISTQNYYINRVHALIDFVDENLDSDFSLHALSERAGFSVFHFHRVFTKMIGETPNVYIRRKKIERIAAILLTGTNESLCELAYKYGFSNGNSFSRAFKRNFGMSPSEYRYLFSKIGVEVATYRDYICRIDNFKNVRDELKESNKSAE